MWVVSFDIYYIKFKPETFKKYLLVYFKITVTNSLHLNVKVIFMEEIIVFD
jgi:hypothetical protein